MPDAFFATKSRKRKRSTSSTLAAPSKKKGPFLNGKSKSSTSSGGPSQVKKRIADEELSDATDEDGLGGVEDLDLRASDEEAYQSGSENENETPAEKRLRLAQLYLDGVKSSLGKPAVSQLQYAQPSRSSLSILAKQLMANTTPLKLTRNSFPLG
jgi:ribosomal RNA-processing protein 9